MLVVWISGRLMPSNQVVPRTRSSCYGERVFYCGKTGGLEDLGTLSRTLQGLSALDPLSAADTCVWGAGIGALSARNVRNTICFYQP